MVENGSGVTEMPCRIMTVPPGCEHDILPRCGAVFHVGFRRFSWNMAHLGRHCVPDSGSREVETLLSLLEVCRNAFTGGTPGAELNRALVLALIAALTEFWSRVRYSQKNYIPEVIALNYIDNHLNVAGLTLESIASYVGCSLRQLHYRFRRRFKISPGEYMRNERMRLAGRLLADPEGDIESVSRQCGYVDRDYFSRVFKQSYGITPGDYRRKISSENQGKI